MAGIDVLSLGSAGMLGREDRAGCLRHIRTQRTDEPDSRQAAKFAKVANNGKQRQTPPLCDSLRLSVLARVVFSDLLTPWAKPPRHLGAGFSHGPSSHNARGLQNNKSITFEASMLLKTQECIVETKLKRTHFARQMCRLNPQIELSLHTSVRAGRPRRKHTARFDKEPARGTAQNPRKFKNSGNKAKKLLKTKEVSFKTNLRETNFVPQTSVLIMCLNQSRIEATRGAGPCHKWFVEEPNRSALQSATKYKNRGNELKDLLQRQGITEIAASKRTHFRAEKAAIGAEPKPRRGDLTQPRPAAWVDGRLANPSPVGAIYHTRNERAPSGLGAGIDFILLAHPGRWPGLC